MKIRHILLALAMLVPLSATNAQHPLVLQRLNQWNDAAPAPSAGRLEMEILVKAVEIYSSSSTCATSEVAIERFYPATADRFVFNAAIRAQVRNGWFVIAHMPGCDAAPVRFMITQKMDSSLSIIRVNRGVSNAWESLIVDTLPAVQVAANAALNRAGIACDDGPGSLGVTRVASEESGLGPETFGIRYTGNWSEIWPITKCDRTVEVLIRFTADGDGGAFTHLPGDETTVLAN